MTALAYRYVDQRALQKALAAAGVPRAVASVVGALAGLVDYRSGASHPRFPITVQAIAHLARYSISHVRRALAVAGEWVTTRRMRPHRMADGTFRQEPNDYEIHVPDGCWREVHRAESSVAARESVRPDEPWSVSVRGKMSERIDSPKVLDWKLDPKMCTTFLDDMPAHELAPKLLDAAMVASEGVDESLRHRTIVCLDELRKRARDVALLACNLSLSSWDAKNVMRHWARKCLMNARIKVDSAAHGINILRKFMVEQRDWLYTLGAQRIERLAREKRERECPTMPMRQTGAEHIAVKFAGRDEPAEVVELEPFDVTDYEPLPCEIDGPIEDDGTT